MKSGTDNTEKVPAKPSRWRLVCAVLLSALVPFAIACAAQYAAIAPSGTESFFRLEVFVLGLLMLLAIVAVPLSVILLYFKRFRVLAVYGLVCGMAFLLGTVGGWKVRTHIRMSAFLLLAERSKPLVEAIKACELDHGKPPLSLDSLVPKYLAHVPATGMGAYPKYEYVVNAVESNYEGNPWVLYVFTPSGGINFDQFIYLPKQNYPATGYGGWLERVGDWAYVHE